MSTGSQITVREVGPRDGLQPEAPLSVEQRVQLIDALLAAGVTAIEAVAFVSPKAVPAMAEAAEVLAAVGRRDGVTVTALVPNVRGAEMAAATGLVDELTATISISETYNQRNVRMSTAESVDVLAGICALGIPVDAVVSCAFGSPYEGDIAPSDVATLCAHLRAAGTARVSLADTTGMATPRRIAEVVRAVDGEVGLHLHETRGTGLLNAYAGLELGVQRFDTSVGGLGGSPFAAGAAGNVATEGLVALCDDLGIETGIDVEQMCEAAILVEAMLERPVPSAIAHAGPRSRLAAGDR